MDAKKEFVSNRKGFRYVVLHGYDQHSSLKKSVEDMFLTKRTPLQEAAAQGCGPFEVQPGDMPGFDLSHLPAGDQTACCDACSREPGCGAFIFSEGRGHCWLKWGGGQRVPIKPGEDMHCGIKTATNVV